MLVKLMILIALFQQLVKVIEKILVEKVREVKKSIENKVKSYLQLLIRFIVSVGLMVWLVTMIDWDEAFQMMKEGSPFYFFLAFMAIQITVATSIWKWKMLIQSSEKKLRNDQVSPTYLGKLYYIGLFFNNFMPGSVGGDVVRIYYLGKKTSVATATTSVLFERITAGFALVGIVLISALFMDQSRPYLISLLVLLIIAVVLYLTFKLFMKKANGAKVDPSSTGKLSLLLGKGKETIVGIGETAKNYRNENWQWWGMILLLSFLFQVGMAWINDLLFRSFGIEVSFLHLLVIITLISVITMIPVSLNGLGVREASYVLFFQSIGVPEGIALSVSLLFFFLVTISSLIGGLFWLMERREMNHEVIG
ncbi:lysylphosphatidylglycerol synthase transmembrane domain-containing protein [Niallia sp. XMNu-256]|uniref:lysylphosphatidylglycerol synthase transmembrane domain-containing protein n=1 Tax=Niallia sp. XMNu-256 TaxID=3082444 RepID=UPI0030CE2D91